MDKSDPISEAGSLQRLNRFPFWAKVAGLLSPGPVRKPGCPVAIERLGPVSASSPHALSYRTFYERQGVSVW